MNTLYRILNLLDAKGKMQKDLCDFLGLQKSTVSEWKSGKSESYKKHLPQIAEFLEVTVNDLIGSEPSAQDPQITILSRAAKNMTKEQRDKLVEMAKLLYPEAFKEK